MGKLLWSVLWTAVVLVSAAPEKYSQKLTRDDDFDSSAGFDCTGKENRAYGVGCSKDYWLCWDGTATEQWCPEDFKFNEENGQCNPAQEVFACTGVRVVSTTFASDAGTLLPVDFDCSGLEDGDYSFAEDCQETFVSCVAGIAYQRSCPAGLSFDYINRICDRLENIIACGGSPPTGPAPLEINFKCPSPFGSFALTTVLCSPTYFVCDNTVAKIAMCADPTIWDDSNKECRLPSEIPECAFDCAGKADGSYSEGCSQTYWWCFEERATKLSCPKDMIFNGENGQCDFHDNIFECTGVRLVVSTSASDFATPPPVDFDCSNMHDGNYAFANGEPCQPKFVSCAGGVAWELSCPAGLLFDPVELACERLERIVACGGSPAEPTTTQVYQPSTRPAHYNKGSYSTAATPAAQPTTRRRQQQQYTTTPAAAPTTAADDYADYSTPAAEPTTRRTYNQRKTTTTTPAAEPSTTETFYDYSTGTYQPYKPTIASEPATTRRQSQTYRPTPAEPITELPEDDDGDLCDGQPDGTEIAVSETCYDVYARCSSGKSLLRFCPKNQVFSVGRGCDFRSNLPECDKSDDTPILKPKDEPTFSPPNFCTGKPDGDYPTGNCLSHFMSCWKNIMTERSCSDGHVFDPRTRVCEQTAWVESCPKSKIIITTTTTEAPNEPATDANVGFDSYYGGGGGSSSNNDVGHSDSDGYHPTRSDDFSNGNTYDVNPPSNRDTFNSPYDSSPYDIFPINPTASDSRIDRYDNPTVSDVRRNNRYDAQEPTAVTYTYTRATFSDAPATAPSYGSYGGSSADDVRCSGRDFERIALGACNDEFIVCKEGKQIRKWCPSGTVFDPSSLNCALTNSIAACVPASPPSECTGRPDGEKIAVRECSDEFIFCHYGKAVHKWCPDGSLFDPKILNCAPSASLPGCKPTPPPSRCVGRPDGDRIALGDCNDEFIVCRDEREVHKWCPDGTVFDPTSLTCAYRCVLEACAQSAPSEAAPTAGYGGYRRPYGGCGSGYGRHDPFAVGCPDYSGYRRGFRTPVFGRFHHRHNHHRFGRRHFRHGFRHHRRHYPGFGYRRHHHHHIRFEEEPFGYGGGYGDSYNRGYDRGDSYNVGSNRANDRGNSYNRANDRGNSYNRANDRVNSYNRANDHGTDGGLNTDPYALGNAEKSATPARRTVVRQRSQSYNTAPKDSGSPAWPSQTKRQDPFASSYSVNGNDEERTESASEGEDSFPSDDTDNGDETAPFDYVKGDHAGAHRGEEDIDYFDTRYLGGGNSARYVEPEDDETTTAAPKTKSSATTKSPSEEETFSCAGRPEGHYEYKTCGSLYAHCDGEGKFKALFCAEAVMSYDEEAKTCIHKPECADADDQSDVETYFNYDKYRFNRLELDELENLDDDDSWALPDFNETAIYSGNGTVRSKRAAHFGHHGFRHHRRHPHGYYRPRYYHRRGSYDPFFSGESYGGSYQQGSYGGSYQQGSYGRDTGAPVWPSSPPSYDGYRGSYGVDSDSRSYGAGNVGSDSGSYGGGNVGSGSYGGGNVGSGSYGGGNVGSDSGSYGGGNVGSDSGSYGGGNVGSDSGSYGGGSDAGSYSSGYEASYGGGYGAPVWPSSPPSSDATGGNYNAGYGGGYGGGYGRGYGVFERRRHRGYYRPRYHHRRRHNDPFFTGRHYRRSYAQGSPSYGHDTGAPVWPSSPPSSDAAPGYNGGYGAADFGGRRYRRGSGFFRPRHHDRRFHHHNRRFHHRRYRHHGRDSYDPFFSGGSYGSPNYGSPSYGGGSYGSPNYGSPNYGGGSYGSPNYGSPNYGSPSYGGGSYGSPSYGGGSYGGNDNGAATYPSSPPASDAVEVCANKPNGYLHPLGHCTRDFCVCYNGKPYQQQCAEGDVFEPQFNRCTQLAQSPTCTPQEPPTTTAPVDHGPCIDKPNGYLQPLGHCSRDFCICYNGKPYQQQCAAGDVFEPEFNRCVLLSQSPTCSPQDAPTTYTPAELEACAGQPDGSLHPMGVCSRDFCICYRGKPYQQQCAEGDVFMPRCGRCLHAKLVPSCRSRDSPYNYYGSSASDSGSNRYDQHDSTSGGYNSVGSDASSSGYNSRTSSDAGSRDYNSQTGSDAGSRDYNSQTGSDAGSRDYNSQTGSDAGSRGYNSQTGSDAGSRGYNSQTGSDAGSRGYNSQTGSDAGSNGYNPTSSSDFGSGGGYNSGSGSANRDVNNGYRSTSSDIGSGGYRPTASDSGSNRYNQRPSDVPLTTPFFFPYGRLTTEATIGSDTSNVDERCRGIPEGDTRAVGRCRRDYIECRLGQANIRYCTGEQVFDSATRNCAVKDSVPQCSSGKTADVPAGGYGDSSAASLSASCKTRADGYYRHPTDCQRFVQCFRSNSFVLSCASGLVFNANKDYGVCDFPVNVPECQNVAGAADAIDAECASRTEGAFFRDPANCNIFYRCVHGRQLKFDCPATTVFNERLNVCDYPSAVPECGGSNDAPSSDY